MSSVSSPRKIYSGNQNLDSRFILEYGRLAWSYDIKMKNVFFKTNLTKIFS
jgi:hypothetical protein